MREEGKNLPVSKRFGLCNGFAGLKMFNQNQMFPLKMYAFVPYYRVQNGRTVFVFDALQLGLINGLLLEGMGQN